MIVGLQCFVDFFKLKFELIDFELCNGIQKYYLIFMFIIYNLFILINNVINSIRVYLIFNYDNNQEGFNDEI